MKRILLAAGFLLITLVAVWWLQSAVKAPPPSIVPVASASTDSNSPEDQATVDTILAALNANFLQAGDIRFHLGYALNSSEVRIRPSELKLSIQEGNNFVKAEGAPIVTVGTINGVIGDGRVAVKYVPLNVNNLYSARMFYERVLPFLHEINFPVLFARVPNAEWLLRAPETVGGVLCYVLEIPAAGERSMNWRERLYVDQATKKKVVKIEVFQGPPSPDYLLRRWTSSYFVDLDGDYHFPQRVLIESYSVGDPSQPAYVMTITLSQFEVNASRSEDDPYFTIPQDFASLPLLDAEEKIYPLPF